MGPKARVGVRIKDAVNGGKSNNRSIDLDALTQRFHVMRKKLSILLGSLRRHHSLIMEMSKSRTNLAIQVSALTENTPLHSSAGALGASSVSYAAINQRVGSSVGGFANKYEKFVVDYVIEWDKVLSNRILAGLKTTEELRRDLDHYQKKVEELRTQTNKTLMKGKMVDDKATDRLKRNEEKFVQAKATFDKAARDMCMILEETTDRCWKDLHPILVKMAQFDMTLANEEAKGLSEMNDVVNALKGLGEANDLKSSGRLKELSSQEAAVLYTGTNSHTVALTNGDVSSQLEGMSMGSFSDTSTSLPPGSVAPQGMGGFPVRIVESPSSGASREVAVSPPASCNSPWANSFTMSSTSPSAVPTTAEMLTLGSSAAPPPTLDQIEGAGGYHGMTSSSSGSLYPNASADSFGSGVPPAAPANGGLYRNPSVDSFGARAVAPPPASPPPPPPDSFQSPASNPFGDGTAYRGNSWSVQPAMSPLDSSMMHQYGQNSYSGSFNHSSAYGMPPPVHQNTNQFGPPPGGYPPTNPFAY